MVITLSVAALAEIENKFPQYSPTLIRVHAPAEVLAARKTSSKGEVKAAAKKIEKLQKEFKLRSENLLLVDNSTTPQDAGNALLDNLGSI